jgi:serine/threonine protein kinase
MKVIQGRDIKYTLGKKLGEGNFGVTYLAIDTYGRQYAIKEFKNIGGSKESRDLEEAALKVVLGSCEAYSVCFIESIQQGNYYYIVMDYVQGKDVDSSIFGKNKIPLKKRREMGYNFMKDLILGLSSIHGFGLIHQDIKGENLMLSYEKVKYIDFGLSCILNTEKNIGGVSVFGVALNEPCGTIGTPLTTPPEMDEDLGLYMFSNLKAHDIWSIGCVILSWYKIPDSEIKPTTNDYFFEFDKVDKYTKIFNEIKEIDPLAYHVIIGLLNRDPDERIDNFNKLVDYFSNPFNMITQFPEFEPNWYDKSVTIQVKKDLCKWRKEIIEMDESLKTFPEYLLGIKNC